jgi:hypothetical protein
MKIQDFVNSTLRYDTEKISRDPELNQELQNALTELGFLKSSIEPVFGVAATAALDRFQQQEDCHEPEFLGPETAQKILDALSIGSRGTAPIYLIVTQNTVLKAKPLDSSTLTDQEKSSLASSTKLELSFFELERSHLRITLVQPVQGALTWYVFGQHAQVLEGNQQVYPPTHPEQVKLDVPYRSQMDNLNNPTGSCNVTCLAMCLLYESISGRDGSMPFEDELYEYALNQGLDRHAPRDLAKIVQDYGASDDFKEFATIDAVKDWLASGKPAVTQGYFTASGHVVALVGYDSTGFLVHDPYGEWCADGYDRNDPDGNNEKGKYQHYSYDMITRTCIASDNSFWVHFISK